MGYRWSDESVTIKTGEYVHWTWTPPAAVTGISYKVEEVADPTSTEYNGGFTSGEAKPTGQFRHQFNKAGVYHYWSGYVDLGETISFRGMVTVEDAVLDKTAEIKVLTNGFEAQKCASSFTFNSNTYTDCTSDGQSFSWCSPSETYTGQTLRCDPLSMNCEY